MKNKTNVELNGITTFDSTDQTDTKPSKTTPRTIDEIEKELQAALRKAEQLKQEKAMLEAQPILKGLFTALSTNINLCNNIIKLKGNEMSKLAEDVADYIVNSAAKMYAARMDDNSRRNEIRKKKRALIKDKKDDQAELQSNIDNATPPENNP